MFDFKVLKSIFSRLNPFSHEMSGKVVVSRSEWGAKTTTVKKYASTDLPVYLIYFTLKSGYPDCSSREECIKVLVDQQQKAIDTDKLSDIPYNFVVANDGSVYEGRGWDAKPEKAITMEKEDFDPRAYDIAFFGDYSAVNVEVPSAPFKAAIDLLADGVKKKYVNEEYDLEAFRGDKFEPEWYPGEKEFKNVKMEVKEPQETEPYSKKGFSFRTKEM